MEKSAEHNKRLSIILGRLPEKTTPDVVETLLNENTLKFKSVEKLDQKSVEAILGSSVNAKDESSENEEFAIIYFENRDDCKYFAFVYFNQFCVKSIAIKVAHKIQFDRSLKIGGKKLHMLLHTKHGDYNP